MKKPTRHIAWSTFKICAALATIIGIAAIIIVTKSPADVTIADAEADISWGFIAPPKSNQQRFVNTLMEEGFAKPRSYDWNGNKFFFSMLTTSESPAEVMTRMQQGFVRNKINKQIYLSEDPAFPVIPDENFKPNAQQIQQALRSFSQNGEFFTGGVVPVSVSDEHFAMTGTLTNNNAESPSDALQEAISAGNNPEEIIKSMRFIEGWKNKESRMTTVTATWSDENLDLKKLRQEGSAKDISVDPNIPACIGCKRGMRFAGEQKESKYVRTTFIGHNTVQGTNSFYKDALGKRGWESTTSEDIMANLREHGYIDTDAVLTTYGRGKEFMSVLIHPDPETGQSITHITEAP